MTTERPSFTLDNSTTTLSLIPRVYILLHIFQSLLYLSPSLEIAHTYWHPSTWLQALVWVKEQGKCYPQSWLEEKWACQSWETVIMNIDLGGQPDWVLIQLKGKLLGSLWETVLIRSLGVGKLALHMASALSWQLRSKGDRRESFASAWAPAL